MEHTTVVNVKVAHIRPKYNNLKEWCEDPQNIYIGRSGIVFINNERYPSVSSMWANPFKVKDASREYVINQYRIYIENKIVSGDISIDDLRELKGKCLGCWCKPEACHGDVLVELIEKYIE